MAAAWTAAIVVTGIGNCILLELDATPESGGRPQRECLLVPGEIAWDGCDCGQLALSIVRDYPTVTFPVDDSLNPLRGGCSSRSRAYEVNVSLTRCVPGVDPKSAKPPSCDQLRTAALTLEGDAYAMTRAIECCLASLKTQRVIFDFRFGGVRRVGPEGNCAAAEGTFIFQLV